MDEHKDCVALHPYLGQEELTRHVFGCTASRFNREWIKAPVTVSGCHNAKLSL